MHTRWSTPVLVLMLCGLPLLAGCQSATALFRANVQRAESQPTEERSTTDSAPAAPTSAPAATDAAVHAHSYAQFNANFLGNPNAALIVTEFGDFHCPYCKRFYQEHFDDFLRDYVDTGLVYFSFRSAGDFLEGGGYVAEAAYCAEDQNAFWPYHDLIFERIDALGGTLETDELLSLAGELGLNRTTFASCLESGKQRSRVEMDGIQFAEIGATGTPSFVINGRLAVSGVNYPALEDAIHEALGGSAALPFSLATLPH